MLRYRLLTALIGIPIALLAIWLGGWALTGLLFLLSLIGLREFYRLAARLGAAPASWIGYLFALGFLITAQARFDYSLSDLTYETASIGLFALLFLAAATREVLRPAGSPSLLSLGATVTGALYLPLLFSFLVLLRGRFQFIPSPSSTAVLSTWNFGARLVLLVFIVCWIADTAAYFAGRAFGRRKLAPSLSPGKTVEGSLAGLVAAAVVGSAFGRAFGLPLSHALLVSAAMGLFGQVGDLAKSRLKREAGVKDFGSLFPGHGGVLDRFDSLLFNSPLAYYCLCLLLKV
jgi:phosphatidate cytidylyltransferase